MKFLNLRKYVKQNNDDVENIVNYLIQELQPAFSNLVVGLEKLGLIDNFESFEASLTIPANTEIQTRNLLRTGVIPSKWIKTGGNSGSIYVTNGDTAWSKDWLYFKNTHASLSATIDIIVFR